MRDLVFLIPIQRYSRLQLGVDSGISVASLFHPLLFGKITVTDSGVRVPIKSFHGTLHCSPLQVHKPLSYCPLLFILLSTAMSSTTAYATQSSAAEYSHPHDDADISRPASPTLVDTRPADRPSITLKIPGGASDILNSVVVDPTGRSLYSVSSTSKRTTLVSCRDNVQVATVEWDRPSPLLVFRQKKMKCRKWLPRVSPETDSRVFTHGETQFSWIDQSTSGYLIPANRPGLSVAQWFIKSHSDELGLGIFQETLVESGLLEVIVLSLVLLRSGRPLGDTLWTLSIK